MSVFFPAFSATKLETRNQIPGGSSPYTAMCAYRWHSGLSLQPCCFRPLAPRFESRIERIFLLKISNVAKILWHSKQFAGTVYPRPDVK